MTNEELLTRTKALRSQSDKEWHEYLDGVIEALEKQIPKKPVMEKRHSFCPAPYCPSCGYAVNSPLQDKFCMHCGQAIDWSD